MTIKPLSTWINNRTMRQIDRFQGCMYLVFIAPEAENCNNTNKRVLIINMFCNPHIHHQDYNMLAVGLLASIQILIELETNVFITRLIKYCFMSMISFMTGTCELMSYIWLNGYKWRTHFSLKQMENRSFNFRIKNNLGSMCTKTLYFN